MNTLAELARALRSDSLTRTELADGSGVILHLDGMQVYSLNETGMFIVDRLCEREEDAEQLVRGMVETFSIDEQTARSDLEQFVAGLHQLLCS